MATKLNKKKDIREDLPCCEQVSSQFADDVSFPS